MSSLDELSRPESSLDAPTESESVEPVDPVEPVEPDGPGEPSLEDEPSPTGEIASGPVHPAVSSSTPAHKTYLVPEGFVVFRLSSNARNTSRG
ncbi:MAG: hypothetical protein ACRBN8_23005 [Nannocystales bacterium]